MALKPRGQKGKGIKRERAYKRTCKKRQQNLEARRHKKACIGLASSHPGSVQKEGALDKAPREGLLSALRGGSASGVSGFGVIVLVEFTESLEP